MIKGSRLFFRIFQISSLVNFPFSRQPKLLKKASTPFSALSSENHQKQQPLQLISYGKQIDAILQKKDLSNLDLVFLSKHIVEQKLTLDNSTEKRLKQQLKKLKQIQFQNLLFLVNLSQAVNNGHFVHKLKEAFVQHFRQNVFQSEKITQFPVPFLKEVGFNLFMTTFGKQEEAIEVLKTLGGILSRDELKKIDNLCSQRLKSMSIDSIVKLLNIFRQLKTKGDFVDLACQLIIQNQRKITPKYLLTTVICMFELGYTEAVYQLEEHLTFNMISEHGFKTKEIIALLQIFHKYKAGSQRIWLTFEKLTKQMNLLNSFQHIFAILSGLTRNYKANPFLLVKFLEMEPSLSYTSNLNEKQFIQFFLVLYFHFPSIEAKQNQQFRPVIIDVLERINVKSVYKEIKYFFLYLFQQTSHKKTSCLKKTYPNDLQLALISLAFPLEESIDSVIRNDYEKDLLERYDKEIWKNNKQIIVVEEFIRHKLISAKKDEFKDFL